MNLKQRIELIRERMKQVLEEGELRNVDKLLLKRALEHINKLEGDIKPTIKKLLKEIDDKIAIATASCMNVCIAYKEGLKDAKQLIKKTFR